MDNTFKIGIVGPTRVGKTSLIASILNDAKSLLAGSPVSMSANGTKTERRVAQHHKELSGSIRAGEFQERKSLLNTNSVLILVIVLRVLSLRYWTILVDG